MAPVQSESDLGSCSPSAFTPVSSAWTSNCSQAQSIESPWHEVSQELRHLLSPSPRKFSASHIHQPDSGNRAQLSHWETWTGWTTYAAVVRISPVNRMVVIVKPRRGALFLLLSVLSRADGHSFDTAEDALIAAIRPPLWEDVDVFAFSSTCTARGIHSETFIGHIFSMRQPRKASTIQMQDFNQSTIHTPIDGKIRRCAAVAQQGRKVVFKAPPLYTLANLHKLLDLSDESGASVDDLLAERKMEAAVLDAVGKDDDWPVKEIAKLRLSVKPDTLALFEHIRTLTLSNLELVQRGERTRKAWKSDMGRVLRQAWPVRTFADVSSDKLVVDEACLASLLPQAISQLDRMHASGFLHGDLAARNICVEIGRQEATVSLIDFGNSARRGVLLRHQPTKAHDRLRCSRSPICCSDVDWKPTLRGGESRSLQDL